MGMKMNFREDYDWSKVSEPFTDDQVKTWVAALRSGDYAQATGQMEVTQADIEERSYRGTPGFCCLGVANKVLDLGNDSCKAVLTKAGKSHVYAGLPQLLQQKLYQMNDNHGKSFSEIADHIEQGFGLKTE